MYRQGVALLGSTGSIGTQTLDVAERLGIPVLSLAAGTNVDAVEDQIRRYRPRIAAMYDIAAAAELRSRVADMSVKVCAGMEGLVECSCVGGSDITVTAVVGMVGLEPTLAAIEAGRDIALANKETLVCAGDLVMRLAAEKSVRLLPVDSEHSAIFQCLERGRQGVKRLILTASGGPFFGYSPEQLNHVTLQDALNHPNWVMGRKITVDSATMINKGLELIEAVHLYGVPPEDVDILVHRESIIHSMVEYIDGSVLAQLAVPDMRLPIQYALTWPERLESCASRVSFADIGALTFARPDYDTFAGLAQAVRAAHMGGTAGTALNAANEAAVNAFLSGTISFTDIATLVKCALDAHSSEPQSSLEQVLRCDRETREHVARLI